MKRSHRWLGLGLLVAALGVGALRVQFSRDLASATARAAQGSELVSTACGPIEVQQAGEGTALLMVHGSGGGHDQGMDWARPMAQAGLRVVAMSRFGYLRTPRPADASPEAQADAHVCLLGSDFLYWTALQVARDQVFRHVLATPPALVHAASAQEQARVNAMAQRVLPLSQRALGLRDDTRLGKGLRPAALETIRVPTLVISARDDGFGTHAGAEYTASRIPGARFIGHEVGGHLLVGHDQAVRDAIVGLVRSANPR
ncbi:MAG: hypothetical protein HY855_22310 [Burkholderiales bacterium]|nr:hypothetical protein [Burkholderiales bacterium]